MTMNNYTLGTRVRIAATIMDKATPPAPIDATVAIKVEAPDGTVTSLSVVNDGVGLYHADFNPATVGLYQYEVLCTGAVVLSAKYRFLVNQGTF